MTMQRYFIHPDLLVGCAADDGNVCMFADVERLKTSHQRLLEALSKIAGWFEAQAKRNDQAVKTCRFESLNDAYRADAKNYRAMAKEVVRFAIAQATKEAQG